MTLKDPKKIIRNLFEKHCHKIDNVFYADKLFVINSVINSLFIDNNYAKVDKQRLLVYGEIINSYLQDEVDIYWQDGKLMVRDIQSGNTFEGG